MFLIIDKSGANFDFFKQSVFFSSYDYYILLFKGFSVGMKNFLLSLLLIIPLATTISGCKNEGQESPSIVGRWEKTNNIRTATEDGKLLSEENEVSYPGELVLEFKTDNSISVTQDGILSSEVTTYSIYGKVITINNTYDGIREYKFFL